MRMSRGPSGRRCARRGTKRHDASSHATHRNGIGSFVRADIASDAMRGASRCAARCATANVSRLVSKEKTRTPQCSTRRDARRVVERDDSEELIFFPRDSARLSSPSRVASSLEPNEPNRTNRTDDRSMDGVDSPFETFLASSLGRRVVVENGAFAHGSRSALRLHDVSSAPRVRGVASRRGRYRVANAATLPDARRVDPTTTIDPCDPCERLWDANRERGVRAVGIDDRHDDDGGDDSNPARGRGDAEVQLRVQYSSNRLCARGTRVTEVCLEERCVSTWRWCVENGCAVNPRPVKEQRWLLGSRRRSGCLLRRRVARGIFGRRRVFSRTDAGRRGSGGVHGRWNAALSVRGRGCLFTAIERALERVATMMEEATRCRKATTTIIYVSVKSQHRCVRVMVPARHARGIEREETMKRKNVCYY